MSSNNAWRYYKHALLSTAEPHETVRLSKLGSRKLWKKYPKALFARWTSDYDCGDETQWWYIVKDEPFEISKLKAKRRYEINKGKRMFRVERIVPEAYIDEIYEVQTAAFSAYPEKYRPEISRDKLALKACKNWMSWDVLMYAAFFRETGECAGVNLLTQRKKCLDFNAQWVKPKFEKHGVNAALVEAVLADWSEAFSPGMYICDGERNVLHETAFQDYLERYFEFRKAYCRLNLQYRPFVGAIVKCVYPFRKILREFGNIGVVHKLNGVLFMETCRRNEEL